MAVHGSGPAPCDWLLVGSEPGYREVRQNRVFVGPTGVEVERLLELCGLTRVFKTNIWREPQDKDDAIHNDILFEEGVRELRRELARVQPRHVITLGREAARLFLGDVDMDECWGLHLLPDPDAFIRLPELRKDVTVLPQTHPAAGFHSPEASSQVLVGFDNLRRVLQERTPARGLYDDAVAAPNYEVWSTLPHLVMGVPTSAPGVWDVALDTEGYPHAPWSVQLSSMAGEAGLVRFDDPEAMRALRVWFKRKPRITMHAGLHDLRMCRAMGIDLIELDVRIDDTQLMAYELGVIPQGLKPLCVRELGMRMQSYQEVLGDAADEHARLYLQWLWDAMNAEHKAACEKEFTFQRDVLKRRIKVLPKLPKSKLHKAAERVLRSDSPARLWGDQVLDLQVEAHRRLGPLPEASLSDVEPDVALRYAARDADGTRRLRDVLEPRLDDMGLRDVYELDLATYPILDRMMQVGITPDPEAFALLATMLDAELQELTTSLRAVTGRPEFNPNSGDQVADYLFDELQLESLGKRTRGRDGELGRESTNDKVLEALERMYPEYPQIADIRSYREYYKLRWTFVARLPEMAKRWPNDGRLHCDLMLTRTPSGRLSAKNPNLLAMPKHGKFAKWFRRCFIARFGRLFLSADESQVELRVGAHLSQDPVMLAIYRGERRNADGSRIDLHAAMAERVLGKKPKDQTSGDRTAAKAINFGYWMGQTAIGLTLELRKGGLQVNEDDAQRWIDEADALYTGAVRYKAHCVEEARKNGYIRCLSGRIRYIGGIRSRDERVRAEAERFAFSTPVQEGAQFLAKRMLATAWRDIFVPRRKAGQYCEPVLWTHDDLLSEVDDRIVYDVGRELKAVMTTAPDWFSVPLDTAPEIGMDWADMSELKL